LKNEIARLEKELEVAKLKGAERETVFRRGDYGRGMPPLNPDTSFREF